MDPLKYLGRRKIYFIVFLLPLLLIFFQGKSVSAETPGIKAEGAILIDGSTKTILFKHNEGLKFHASGASSLITSLIALEMGDFNDKIKVPSSNEEVTLEELLKVMLVEDNYDAENALAINMAGSSERLIEIATKRLTEMGLNSTEVSTLGELYTVPYDLAMLYTFALQNEYLRKVLSQGVNIVKAGKGYTLTSATLNGQQLVAVVVNSKDVSADTQSLLDYGFQNYQLYNFVNKGDLLKSISIKDGEIKKVGLLASKDLRLVLPKDLDGASLEEIIEVRENIKAPVEKWEELGTYKVLLDEKVLGSVPLLSDSQVQKKSFPQKILEWFMALINFFG